MKSFYCLHDKLIGRELTPSVCVLVCVGVCVCCYIDYCLTLQLFVFLSYK